MTPEERLDHLKESLEHIGRIQVDADTIYHNRGSVIIIAQGFFAVAAESLFSSHNHHAGAGLAFVGAIGCTMSVLWYLFEQRNQAYFTARGRVLEELEQQVIAAATPLGLAYPAFWTRVPADVRTHARWYQRFSAPRINRTIIPLLFAASWLVVAISPLFFHFGATPPTQIRLVP